MYFLNSITALIVVAITILITNLHGKPLSAHHDHRSFQDLSQNQFVRDYKTSISRGYAPIQLTKKSHSQKDGNMLWGFEQGWKEIECMVQASPAPEFQWKYRGLNIDPDAADRNTLVITSQEDRSILKVKVHESSLGEYTCRASNELGASERNFFLSRAAKPQTPKFETEVVPNSGILVKVTGLHKHHRKHLHVIQIRGFKDTEELGEILPIKGYIIQLRKMRSCDEWRNVTMNSDKKFLSHHLLPGTIYRMRVAAKTEGGIGEFSRAQTVNYRLSDEDVSGEYDRGIVDGDTSSNNAQTSEGLNPVPTSMESNDSLNFSNGES